MTDVTIGEDFEVTLVLFRIRVTTGTTQMKTGAIAPATVVPRSYEAIGLERIDRILRVRESPIDLTRS